MTNKQVFLPSLLFWGAVLLALVGAGSGCNFRGIRRSFELNGLVPSASGDPAEFLAAFFQTTGARIVPGHRLTLEANGTVFAEIENDILNARVSVNFDEYIWEPGRASDQLLSALGARHSGVTCRVLTDPLGSPDFEKKIAPRLRSIGCEPRTFRRLSTTNLFERNHRKIVVIDGRIAYLGGFGVRDEWLSGRRHGRSFRRRTRLRMVGEWRDDNLRLLGPAVNDVQRAFAQNWQEAGGSLLPAIELPAIAPDGDARAAFVSSSAGYLTEAERLVHLLIKSARKRVWIANAYFVPDESLVGLLCEKSRQGVDVQLLLPGRKNDIPVAGIGQRRLYRQLLSAGVRIFEYQPAMMHAKTLIIDDGLSMMGSLNLNLLSLNRLEEAILVIEDRALVEALDQSWQDDLRESRQITRPGSPAPSPPAR